MTNQLGTGVKLLAAGVASSTSGVVISRMVPLVSRTDVVFPLCLCYAEAPTIAHKLVAVR